MSLSVVINTKNMAETLERTLESIKDIADEIVIVDMNSTDDTVKVAKKYTKKIFNYKEELGFADPARNFALSKATSDWILVLDADEEIERPLAKTITRIVAGEVFGLPVADAYWLPRKNIIFNKWIERTGWGEDYQLRLFKRGQVVWTDKVHTHPVAQGVVAHLPAEEEYSIVHHNYQTISQFIERLNRYTDIQAKQSDQLGSEVTVEQPLNAFVQEFFRRFFVYRGIEEGIHGLSLSMLQGMYEITVVLKQWEKRKFSQTGNDQAKTFAALRQFQQGISYWVADWHVQHSTGWKKVYWQLRRKLKV